MTPEEILAAPKILLHDHLDGGLRPQTIIDLAAEIGYDLPTTDADELRKWFRDSADSGSLVRYLEGFAHTVAVCQTAPALTRVGRECVEDLVADGVVYAEVRFAPELFTENGLSMAQSVEAVLEGFAQGMELNPSITVNALLCAMRQNDRSREVAQLVIDYRGAGVVGMDIAGPEDGFPSSLHAEAFADLRRASCRYTIHAGEAAGVESIVDALAECSAERLGHGVRIVEDITIDEDEAELGPVANYVRNRQIPLEVAPSSNLQTGIADSIADHPITLLQELGYAVTINTDNRLMSGTTVSREMELLVSEAGWTREDLYGATLNAVEAAFLPLEEKADLIVNVLDPWWAPDQ